MPIKTKFIGEKGGKMARKENRLGSWAFLIGLVIAVIVGFGFGGNLNQGMVLTLFVIGLIVGLLNVADEEATPFLMSGVVLVIVASLSKDVLSTVAFIGSVLDALLILFVPATVIVAVKNVFQLAKH